MVLGAAGCKILVQADLDKRRIDIAVAGPKARRRSALSMVLDDLDEVHKRNPEINPRALVPLTDEPQLAESYEHLLKLEERYGSHHRYLPRDANREYAVGEMLDGVRRERRVPARYERDDERGQAEDSRRRPEVPDKPSAGSTGGRVKEKPAAGAGAARQLVIVIGAVCLLIMVLGGIWWATRSTPDVLAIVCAAALLLIIAGTWVLASIGILQAKHVQGIFLKCLEIIRSPFDLRNKDRAGRK